MSETIKLTSYSHGGGCGCKISPSILEKILTSNTAFPDNKKLVVGNNSKDDAAVYDLGNGIGLISTTDFFMPIVDDPLLFGKIASANAISDVYAMGGKPVLAIAILGWPVEKLSPDAAQKVIEGSRLICAEAGIALAGGHSIDSPEPIFGLAVNGLIDLKNLKQNNTATEGDYIFLTKRIGVGILSTAQKKGALKDEHYSGLIRQLITLNNAGEELGKIKGVNAMTDVTGFGVLGHLIEMAEGSGLSAEIFYSRLHMLDGVNEYLEKKIMPGATSRNWNSYSNKVLFEEEINNEEALSILPDPQTNGGLLVAVNKDSINDVMEIFSKYDLGSFKEPIGKFIFKKEKAVIVKL